MKRLMRLDNRKGYTLGELLWVIVILSIIAGLAIPRLDWMKYRVNSEQRNISMQFNYAQRLAVSLQHNVQVTIDRANRRLVVDEDQNNDGTFTAGERRRVVILDDGVNFERNGVADLPSPAPTTELTTIIYRRDGSADQAGVVFINTNRGVVGSNNKDARALEIIRATGRADAYRLQGGTWVKGAP